MIKLIAAVSRNGVIGIADGLPWHLPSDLKHFKHVTRRQAVIMGRKTWDSLPESVRPLPGRDNHVISTNAYQQRERRRLIAQGATPHQSVGLAVEATKRDAWIIGGGQIYAHALQHGFVDRIVLSEIDVEIEGDTYFPTGWRDHFVETYREQMRNDNLSFDIVTYDRPR